MNCIVARIGRAPYIEIFSDQGTLRIQGHQAEIATTNSPDFVPASHAEPMEVSEFPIEIQGYVHSQWNLYSDLGKSLAGESSNHFPNIEDGVRVQRIMDSLQA